MWKDAKRTRWLASHTLHSYCVIWVVKLQAVDGDVFVSQRPCTLCLELFPRISEIDSLCTVVYNRTF